MVNAAFNSIAENISATGGKTEQHHPEGKPSAEIARLATELDADLIIVGKHGQNWSQSMLVGSTAANLCEIARRPVLMVPVNNTEV